MDAFVVAIGIVSTEKATTQPLAQLATLPVTQTCGDDGDGDGDDGYDDDNDDDEDDDDGDDAARPLAGDVRCCNYNPLAQTPGRRANRRSGSPKNSILQPFHK